jgi:hypothetical protein
VIPTSVASNRYCGDDLKNQVVDLEVIRSRYSLRIFRAACLAHPSAFLHRAFAASDDAFGAVATFDGQTPTFARVADLGDAERDAGGGAFFSNRTVVRFSLSRVIVWRPIYATIAFFWPRHHKRETSTHDNL